MLAAKIALIRALALTKLRRFDEARSECASGQKAAGDFGLPYEQGLLDQADIDIAALAGRSADYDPEGHVTSKLLNLGVVRTPRLYSL